MEVEHRQNPMKGLSNRRLMNYYNQMSGLNQNVLNYELNRRLGAQGMTSLASNQYDQASLGLNSGYDQASLGQVYDQADLNQQNYLQANQGQQSYNQANLGLGYGQNQLGFNGYNRQGLNAYNQGYNDLYDQNLGYSNYAGYGYGNIDRQGFGFNDYDYGYSPSVGYAYAGGGGGCSFGGVSPLLGLITLAGAGLGFYFIWNRLQAITGRQIQLNFLDFLDFVYKGNFR